MRKWNKYLIFLVFFALISINTLEKPHPMESSEKTLSDAEFQALKKGQTAAFRKIYDQYFGLVQFTLTKLNLSKQDRDELTQETFLKFYKNLLQFTSKDGLKAWLVITAKNLGIDLLRKQKVKKEDLKGDDSNIAVVSFGKNESQEFELLIVQDLLVQISEETGDETLEMFYVRGWSTQEIAQKKGVAVSTVTTQLTRLRRRFQDMLKSRIEEYRNQLITG